MLHIHQHLQNAIKIYETIKSQDEQTHIQHVQDSLLMNNYFH